MQDERTGKLKKKPQPPKSKVQTQQIKPDRNNNDNFFQDEEGFDFSGGFTNSGNNGNKTAIYKINEKYSSQSNNVLDMNSINRNKNNLNNNSRGKFGNNNNNQLGNNK